MRFAHDDEWRQAVVGADGLIIADKRGAGVVSIDEDAVEGGRGWFTGWGFEANDFRHFPLIFDGHFPPPTVLSGPNCQTNPHRQGGSKIYA